MLPMMLVIFAVLALRDGWHIESWLGPRHVFRQFASSSKNSRINSENTLIRKCLEMAMDTQALRGRLRRSNTRSQHIRILFQSHQKHQLRAAQSLKDTCASHQNSSDHQSRLSLTNKPEVHSLLGVPLFLELTQRLCMGFSSLL